MGKTTGPAKAYRSKVAGHGYEVRVGGENGELVTTTFGRAAANREADEYNKEHPAPAEPEAETPYQAEEGIGLSYHASCGRCGTRQQLPDARSAADAARAARSFGWQVNVSGSVRCLCPQCVAKEHKS